MAITLTDVARAASRTAARTAPTNVIALVASVLVPARSAVKFVNNQIRPVNNNEKPDGISVLGAAQGAVCEAIRDGLAVDVLTVANDIDRFFWLAQTGSTLTATEPATGQPAILVGYTVGFFPTTRTVLVDIVDLGLAP
jgi:hypothetical protein